MSWWRKLFGIEKEIPSATTDDLEGTSSLTVGDLRRAYQDCHAKLGAKADHFQIKWLLPDGAYSYSVEGLRGKLEYFSRLATSTGGMPDRIELKSAPQIVVGETQYKGREMPIVKIEINWDKDEVVCHYGVPYGSQLNSDNTQEVLREPEVRKPSRPSKAEIEKIARGLVSTLQSEQRRIKASGIGNEEMVEQLFAAIDRAESELSVRCGLTSQEAKHLLQNAAHDSAWGGSS